MPHEDDFHLEIEDKIFENERDRRELQEQMAQLSPRREVKDGRFDVMTLPFCEDISPSAALKKLFDWFHVRSGDDDDEEETTGDDDGRERSEDGPPSESMSLEEFNRLRKCIGKAEIDKRSWSRVLEELGMPEGEDRVRQKDFKALFGPPPFFGSERVEGIVKYVMSAEEHIHFALILLDRFGVDAGGSGSSGVDKVIGPQELRNIQTASCVEMVYGEAEWSELLKKLNVPEDRLSLNWMEFAELFTVTVKGKKVFGATGDPASVVYAVLANEKVLDTVKDPDDTIVSRKAFTNLLRLKQKKVDDEKWMQLLEQMQSTYQYRKGRRVRRDSAATAVDEMGSTDAVEEREDGDGGTEVPLVVVRNTRNQVLSYEITFDDHGDVGIQLQSDFYGHCLTVASIGGQASKHPIIQQHDIVAMIDDTSLTFDRMASSKAEEAERIALGMRLLEGDRVRKITFQRQESYFQYDHEQHTLHLFMKTLEEIPPQGKFVIHLPTGQSWAPITYTPGNEMNCLSLKFDVPTSEELDYTTIQWVPATESIEISLEGYVAIEANSTVVMQIGGLLCGSVTMVGPCDVTEGTLLAQLVEGQMEEQPPFPTHFVSLYTDWKNRETTIQRNPIRERVRRVGEYFDRSLEPIRLNFSPGESGLSLASDFFGQCAVVESVKEFSQAAAFGIQQFDILTSIAVVGENDSLDLLNCIKPFALNKRNAENHIRDIRKRLQDCHKSGRMYRLQFLRLNSHFFHDNGRTIFNLRALITLSRGSALVVRMPSSKWHADGKPLMATVVEPIGVRVKEVIWDSQKRVVNILLDECSIPESSQVVIEIQGITPGLGDNRKCAGPGEVVGVHVGDTSTVSEMEFELHEHWHSFVVGHQGLEASKVVDTLKQFDTSPAKLWEVLEYTSLLFDMFKSSPEADHMSLTDLNRLVRIVCGDGKKMNTADWNSLCRNMGAKPLFGLTRRQFACCWYDVVGLSSHNAKDTYIRLQTAERIFKELISIYQENDEEDSQEMMGVETIDRLARFVGISSDKKKKVLKELGDKGLEGWDCDTFSQIVCGKHPIIKIGDKDAMTLWMKLFYSKKLFGTYSSKKLMRKKNLSDLLDAARIHKPKLTNELWASICDSVGIRDNSGLKLSQFLDAYSSDMLGPRHAVADWYRIETFKLLPEKRAKADASKEAVLNVAPEVVDVNSIASKAFEQSANTEELFQDLLEKGLEFSKLEKFEERVSKDFKFDTNLTAKKKTRARGFLHIHIRGIAEVTDHIVQRDSSFNPDNKAEQLYVLLQVTNSEGLKPRLPNQKPRNWGLRVLDKLFGEEDFSHNYVIEGDEKWDHNRTQTIMRAAHDAEKTLRSCKQNSPEYAAALTTLKEIEQQLMPNGPHPMNNPPDWRVFSSLILRDPSPDAIISFPDDQFRLYVPEHHKDDHLFVVCKLFKCVGSESSRLQIELTATQDKLKKAEGTFIVLKELVEQQRELLKYEIAEEYSNGKELSNDPRSKVWMAVAKLKQKRQDVDEFEKEVKALQVQVGSLSNQLKRALEDDRIESANAQQPASTAPADSTETKAPPALTSVNVTPQRTKFIGQAFFDLNALLDVLHDDKETTEDLAVFRTETHNDVGVLVVHFQYKCATLQDDTQASELPLLHIQMALEEETETVDDAAFEYPPHSNLEVEWHSDILKAGDRICLIREGLKYKTGMPYFLLLWSPVDSKGKPVPLKDVDDDGDVTGGSMKQICDWIVPEVLKRHYSPLHGTIVETNESRREGKLLFPSSLGLNLPPGIYKLYLIRNETVNGMNYRTVLGTSPALLVLPGLNGVHTSFGTTPLVDVKPLRASLQVFSDQDRENVASALANTEGYQDDLYLKRATVEQELEVVYRDLEAARMNKERAEKKRQVKSLSKYTSRIDELESIMKRLLEEQKQILASISMRNEGMDNASPNQVALRFNNVIANAQTVIRNSDKVVFSFRFDGGAPSPHDRVLLLPADVVRVSDVLRSTILGKLQANDPRQVEKVRATMEKELNEIEEFYNGRISVKKILRVFKRLIRPFMINLTGEGATNKSDAYNAATGAQDSSFVWEECLSAYNTATVVTRKNFAYIIRDLLDEIDARKEVLGLKSDVGTRPKSQFNKVNERLLQKVGIEIRIPPLATIVNHDSDGRLVATGEVSTKLGFRYLQGGFYVAKYVRRMPPTEAEDALVTKDAVGELCRYGPFFIEPALFSFSPRQVAFALGQWVMKAVMSEQGKLTLKVIGQAYLALVKYFLSVVSLSFNINVLAGNFNINVDRLNELLHAFQTRLLKFYGPFQIALTAIYDFFGDYITELMESLDMSMMAGECMSGFFLYAVLIALFFATFVVYVVVQEDLLLKVQKLHTILPFNPGKTMLGFIEQTGGLLVIPMYLAIKSCVLFISGNWSDFYHVLNDTPSKTLENLKLYRTATATCPDATLAKVNHGFGVAALVLIVFFLFVCLPLLLLDLFSWVPLTELEKPEVLDRLAHSNSRKDIRAAVHSNANLVEFHPIRHIRHKVIATCKCCKNANKSTNPSGCCGGVRRTLLGGFALHYDDYMNMSFRELLKKYGYIGLLLMFINIYAHLMLQSIGRALGVFLGWRLQAEHMYSNPLMHPKSKWKIADIFCLRFNIAWKVQYIKDKMVMPFVNICLVTLGIWGEQQWKEFNVEDRADDCYRMEPSGEVKQLQMMALHGKIISLFWLCVPETMVLAYLAEVLNRGPMFSYFLNDQFLQADIPESEREKDPVWRFHPRLGFRGEENVIYMSDTRFVSTLCKWSSSIVEIVSLLMVYPPAAKNRTVLLGITLISAVVTPLLEFNQQLIKAYMEYVEAAEKVANSNGCIDKVKKVADLWKKAKGLQEAAPEVQINLRAYHGDNAKNPPAKPGEGAGALGPGNGTAARSGAPFSAASNHAKYAAHLAGTNGGSIALGSDDYHFQRGNQDEDDDRDKSDESEEEEEDDDEEEQARNPTAVASLVAASGLVQSKKELIQLTAMPDVCYVVLTNGLGAGEGELTINWQVNARQRFHALDAIGMFPAKEPGDVSIRTMDECICYRLLKHRDVEPFGWSPRDETDDAERELIIRQAKSLRDLSEQEVTRMANKSIAVEVKDDEEAPQEIIAARKDQHRLLLERADVTMQTMMGSPKLRPYKKKMNDMLEEEIVETNLYRTSRRLSRAFSKNAAAKEEAAKKIRKVVSGQVKFRPARNSPSQKPEEYEPFIYGNDVGIYQSKYGLHGYEFCYLRYIDTENKIVGLANGNEKSKVMADRSDKPLSLEARSQKYEILERFMSNAIQIGTFHLYMSLTCDRPLVGAGEKVNLSWIIHGVNYGTLKEPLMRNCIGFYRVCDPDSSANGEKKDYSEAKCARIEIIPPSAYLEVEKSQPCPGRMTVNAPSEPGLYEIRFLFNFFGDASLHRQCQIFGELEDEMQQLRIRSFYERRAVAEELRKFTLREPKLWGIARMNTHAWLKAMLLSTIREPVESSVLESTSNYSEFLLGVLKEKLEAGLRHPSCAFQDRIAQMLAPFRMNAFLGVLMVAFQSNSEMNDHLASITFISPTEEDEKMRGLNKERDMLLLSSDQDLLMFGSVAFRPMTLRYLHQRSLCGYIDFVDDIVLTHSQLMETFGQVVSNLSSSCVILYESAIASAIKDMAKEAEALNRTNALVGIDVMLMDLCRNHMQSIIRALLETDCRTGMRWPEQPREVLAKITALRTGIPLTREDDTMEVVVETDVGASAPVFGPKVHGAPMTRQYIALRRWIRPKLERKIMTILKQRHARLLNGNMTILAQMLVLCRRPDLSLVGNPFPNHRTMRTASPLYFLEESRRGDAVATTNSLSDSVTLKDNQSLEDLNKEDAFENNDNQDERDDGEKQDEDHGNDGEADIQDNDDDHGGGDVGAEEDGAGDFFTGSF